MIFSFPVALSLPLPTSGLASEAKEDSFAFPKCHQFSRKLWEMSAVFLATLSGWGFSLVSLEKQVFGLRFPLGSFFRSSLREWVWPGRRGCGQAALGAGGCRAASWSQEGTASADLHNCLVRSLSSSSAHCFGVAALGG